MDFAQLSTITDAHVLRKLVVEKIGEIAKHQQTLATRDETIRNRDIHIEALTHEIARLRRVQFAARSERMNPEQRALFDESMDADLAVAEAVLEALRQPTDMSEPAAPRNRPKRRPLPPELPRVTTVHEPDCQGCERCGGALVKIGEHVRERLACKPIEFFVQRQVFAQYACRPCERVVATPVPPAILDRSQAAPSLLAQSLPPRRRGWRSPSTSIICRCTGRKRSTHAAACRCRARPWPSGSARSVSPCSRWWMPPARRCCRVRCCTPTKPRSRSWSPAEARPGAPTCSPTAATASDR